MSSTFSQLNFSYWDQTRDKESGVIKNVRAGWKATPPWPQFYKELKDTITQFLSRILTEHYGIRNCEPPSKSLLQNYCCSAAH